MDFYAVLIERDASTKIPLTVPEYEIPVLQAIHGDDRVHFVGDNRPVPNPRPDRAFDPFDAYGALLRKYRQFTDAVRFVYASPQILARKYPAEAAETPIAETPPVESASSGEL